MAQRKLTVGKRIVEDRKSRNCTGLRPCTPDPSVWRLAARGWLQRAGHDRRGNQARSHRLTEGRPAMRGPLFDLGHIVATPGALRLFEEKGADPLLFSCPDISTGD